MQICLMKCSKSVQQNAPNLSGKILQICPIAHIIESESMSWDVIIDLITYIFRAEDKKYELSEENCR